MKPVVEEVDVLQQGDQPYTVAMLKAETDFSGLRPLRASSIRREERNLQLGRRTPAEPVPLPLDRWTVGA